ncbi:OmpA family protein [Moritella viscosa]|uniref:OmpA/MotB domain protein n=1 Tax=Moritella viscosa TaxID=80854 RepID=A0A1K9ZSW6_9GAMM|nr:OmpA family protein [Moritella viscosa]SGY99699.1 OmpA/MotB domain protein [Moritella viscosa]
MKALTLVIYGLLMVFTATATAMQKCEKINNDYVFTESIENKYSVITNKENNLHESELQPNKQKDNVNSINFEETRCYDVSSSRTLVSFDFDKYNIKDSEKLVLDALVIRDDLPANLVVVGHTDNEGHAEYNHDLGLRRANAVKQYLEIKGIKHIRLITRSEGLRNPRCVGEGKGVGECNRRVEIFYEAL